MCTVGGQSLIINHYKTTNQQTYGAYWEGFNPTITVSRRPGYVYSVRPATYYNPGIDVLDKIGTKCALKSVYTTTNHVDFKDCNRSQFDKIIPANCYKPSDVMQQGVYRGWFTRQLSNLCHSDKCKMPEGDPEARYRPLLWRVLNKGPIERENMYRGLAPWSTEYNSNYSPKTFGIDTCAFDDTQVGVPESTGYVINKKTEEPFLYQSPPLPMAKTSYTLEFRPYRPRTVDVHTDGGPKTVLPDGFSIGNKADVDFMPLTDKNIPSCFGEKLYGCARELFKRDMPKYWNSYHASAFPGMSQCDRQVRSIERRPDLPDARLGRNCKDLKPCLKDGTNDGSIFKSANAGQRKTCTFAELVNVDSQPRKVTGGVVGLDKFAPKVATAFQPAGVPDYECKTVSRPGEFAYSSEKCVCSPKQ